MDTMIKNKKTGVNRWVSYTRQYICITRDNGVRYYKYSARRVYVIFAIAKSIGVQRYENDD